MGRFKTRFSNFTVTSKLAVLIYMFIASLLVMALFSRLLFNTSQTVTILVSEQRVFVENFNSGIKYFYQYEISGNEDYLEPAKNSFRKAHSIAFTFARIDSLIHAMDKNEWVPLFYAVFKEGANYDYKKVEMLARQIHWFVKINPDKISDIQKTAYDASLLAENVIGSIESYRLSGDRQELNELEEKFLKVNAISNEFSSSVYNLIEYINLMMHFFIAALVLLLIVSGTLIAIKISRSISNPVKRLAENFKKIAKGNLKSSVKIDTENEIGELSKAFSEIQVGLQEIISYTKNVAKGDYSAKLKPKSEEDELTISLNKMVTRLEEIKVKNEKEIWIQNGISDLEDQMRGNFSVRELSNRIISFLTHFMKAEMGAVYVFDEVLGHLELTGSVGINTSEVKKIITPGDSLIGKAALQKALQVIDTKNKFLKVYSATGEISPEKIYLLPMHYENHIQAVIELAPVNEFSELKIEFLKQVAEKISVNLGAAVARFRNKELLDKTLEQAEELKARDEELQKELNENIRIKENLIREKALLDSMLKTLPDYVYFKDTESRFLRVSESMAGRFGSNSTKEIIGKTDFDFRPKQEAQKYFNEEQEIIKQGQGFVNQIRNGKDRNGEEYWNSVTKLPLYDETGKCIGTFGISKDVTAIKKLEIEVRLRNEKLQKQQEELKAKHEELKAQEEELRVANEELKSQEEELRVANEELAEQTKILSESEKKLHAQQEKLREVNKNLRLASQYKSEFLANMSHELRTPLNSLLILSKLLSENKKRNLTEEQLKSVRIIHKSGKDLLDLINEILDLSKIEAGKMTYHFNEVNTEEVKSEIIHSFKPVAENKGLKFEVNQSPGFPEVIYSDKQRLLQIIRNLLSNAFKFTAAGGIKVNLGLTPASKKLHNPDLKADNTFFIAVEDTGVGIPQSKADDIFEAFQQADGSISRKYGGTGLGLSISKQLTQVLGGEIHVESTEEKGSVFTVYLPLDSNLVGIGYKDVADEKAAAEHRKKTEEQPKIPLPETSTAKEELPVFIADDRNATVRRLTVLIIHNKKEKAQQLIDLCHNRNFDALVASNIDNGIKLATTYSPEAIIISDELKDSGDLIKFRENKFTSRLPLHIVSRIEDSILNEIEELTTPESEKFGDISKNLGKNRIQEFKQILVVEDDPATREAIHQLFENKDIVLHYAETGRQAYEMIAAQPFDSIILDLGLPDFSGNELLRKLKTDNVPIPNVIIHTAKELSRKELRELQKFSDSIVIKGLKSDERLMDEVTLFLHQVANKAPKAQLVAQDISEEDTFKGKKVLVVDDDIRNVFAIAQILEEREIEVLEAENGAVALEVLKSNPDIDLVLMDIMMPVMDGYETMKTIRNTPETASVPIITLSAKAMKEDYQKAIDKGANDYISKPVDVQKLLALLKIWLYK